MLRPALASAFVLAGAALVAADTPYNPTIAPASEEGVLAIQRMRAPAGVKIELFAAEPQLANPVAFCIDERGRFYVAETFRLHAGVTDIRKHMSWLDDDLAARTVADREALYRKHLGKDFASYGIDHDRVRLLEDTDGDGKADRATVFADGFRQPVDGLGAGLLARRGRVWFTCIPSLWQLRDTDGDGRADERKALHTGYGVHVGFIGHDLHGLCLGPDGKLYFSIGDRGLHVETQGRTLAHPDAGAVLRCNPDGSDLEIFATGLRNPQELAFDRFGNLFTCDNNSDGGDKARWVYLVEGGDSGWRIGYQFITAPVSRGPWNAEKLWHPQWAGQAAYHLPPLLNIADGPSGLTYHPGITLLPERYKDHFFLADFRGGSNTSGIRSFAVRPKGASFEVTDAEQCAWSVLATDVDFGPDGALYVSDWVEGWNKPNKGRLYRLHDPARAGDPAVTEVKRLLAQGFEQRPMPELLRLLGHADQRIRREAQFALAERGRDAAAPLLDVAARSDDQMARLHALWALGQIKRQQPETQLPIQALHAHPDAETRAQLAKLLGDHRVSEAAATLRGLLGDTSPRVRFFAALAVGKLGDRTAVEPVLQLLRDNADRDPYLRHAGVMALAGCADAKALAAAARDSAPAVRLGVLLALRRLGSAEVAPFLHDPEPRLAVEAARAINDAPIPAAVPRLAALLDGSDASERALRRVLRSQDPAARELAWPLVQRALNANLRLGQAEHATAVAAFAARDDAPEETRLEALRLLGDWAQPSGRDRVVGLWRPLQPRPMALAAEALRPALAGILGGPPRVRQEAARLAAKLGIKDVGPVLAATAADTKLSAEVRVEALEALEALGDARLTELMQQALRDGDARVRTEGRRLLARHRPTEAVPVLEAALERGSLPERQGALRVLADLPGEAADRVLAAWLDRLLANQVPAEVQLDLLDAASKRTAPALKERLTAYEARRAKQDPLAPFRETLAGGDADAGRQTFHFKAEVSCLRCHKVKGEGGEVGPDLTGIGSRQTREYLLEALVDPSRQIAKGFETVVLETKKGQVLIGLVKAEDDRELKLMTAEGTVLTVPRAEIVDRQAGKSAMPEDVVKYLSKRELRDLVEFLAGLK